MASAQGAGSVNQKVLPLPGAISFLNQTLTPIVGCQPRQANSLFLLCEL